MQACAHTYKERMKTRLKLHAVLGLPVYEPCSVPGQAVTYLLDCSEEASNCSGSPLGPR